MKLSFTSLTVALLSVFIFNSAYSQNSVEEYWNFIEQKNYSIEQFNSENPVGVYKEKAQLQQDDVLYLDSIKQKYELSEYELKVLKDKSFVVSERLKYPTMWDAARDVFVKDLPLFITSDYILDAFHHSYSALLKNIEKSVLVPKLSDLLDAMHYALLEYSKRYSAEKEMQQKLNDVDIYVSVARNLLNPNDDFIEPALNGNSSEIKKILKMIKNEKPGSYPLFSGTAKKLDFSQFKPRGHYTGDEQLEAYFRTLMWLGRIELYLTAPVEPDASQPKQKPEDIQRQIIDAVVIYQLITENDLYQKFSEIDKTIEAMVGISDNVQLKHIGELLKETGIKDPAEFLDMKTVKRFQSNLSEKDYAEQQILSHIMYSDPFRKEQIKPASSFLMFGQRFLVDSYITGNLVYDKIIVDGQKVRRMLPSVYDVLFALGNEPARHFLKKELEEYKYHKNLAALKKLVSSYKESYWENSIYNLWLNAVRSLNTPDNTTKNTQPLFMQTAAWNQSK